MLKACDYPMRQKGRWAQTEQEKLNKHKASEPPQHTMTGSSGVWKQEEKQNLLKVTTLDIGHKTNKDNQIKIQQSTQIHMQC